VLDQPSEEGWILDINHHGYYRTDRRQVRAFTP